MQQLKATAVAVAVETVGNSAAVVGAAGSIKDTHEKSVKRNKDN